jgi:hypothetical protein
LWSELFISELACRKYFGISASRLPPESESLSLLVGLNLTFESIDCIPMIKIKATAVAMRNPRGRCDPIIGFWGTNGKFFTKNFFPSLLFLLIGYGGQ